MRGIAILLVIGFHISDSWLPGGYIGVDIFFVLSGFLITALLVAEHDSTGSINLFNFYLRRVLRLAPALLVFLGLFVLASLLLADKEEAKKNAEDAILTLTCMANWTRAAGMLRPDLLGHAWALSVEGQFYLLWPIALRALLRRKLPRAHLLLVLLGMAIAVWAWRSFLFGMGASPSRMYNGLDTRADALLVGCALGIAGGTVDLRRGLQKRKIILQALSLGGACLILATALVVPWRAACNFLWLFLSVAVSVGLIIAWLLVSDDGAARRLLEGRVLGWVGGMSYGLFLWHYPIFRIARRLGASNLGVATYGVGLTLLVSVASYYVVELPGLRLKKKISKRFR